MRNNINFSYMKNASGKGAAFVRLTGERGLKAKLAKLLGVELPVINNWKKRGVPSSYANAVAEILHCKPEEISDIASIEVSAKQGQQASAEISVPASPAHSPANQLLMAATEGLTEKQIARLIQVAGWLEEGRDIRPADLQPSGAGHVAMPATIPPACDGILPGVIKPAEAQNTADLYDNRSNLVGMKDKTIGDIRAADEAARMKKKRDDQSDTGREAGE